MGFTPGALKSCVDWELAVARPHCPFQSDDFFGRGQGYQLTSHISAALPGKGMCYSSKGWSDQHQAAETVNGKAAIATRWVPALFPVLSPCTVCSWIAVQVRLELGPVDLIRRHIRPFWMTLYVNLRKTGFHTYSRLFPSFLFIIWLCTTDLKCWLCCQLYSCEPKIRHFKKTKKI